MTFRLEMAMSDAVSGLFTLESALDGTDVLGDIDAFSGTYDDLTGDVDDVVTVETGTDALAGQVQASSMTCTVCRPDDPGYYNPNNPSSPLKAITPGFVPMRPGRLSETDADGVEHRVFYGFLRRAKWRATSRDCQLYFEDLLFRLSRIYPVIPSTGPTATGEVIGLILDAAGWTWPDWRDLAVGDPLDDWSADGSQSAPQLLGALLEAERGTVFVRGDGVFVYESRDMPLIRAAAWTVSTETNAAELDSAIDADSLLTRATVTKTDPTGDTDGTTWTVIDADAERDFGRGDVPSISSPYIPDPGGYELAEDLVYQGVNGSPPLVVPVTAADDETLLNILTSPLQTVVEIDDPLGSTEGEYVIQRAVHTVSKAPHVVEYTLTKRLARAFTLVSALDGPDRLRY